MNTRKAIGGSFGAIAVLVIAQILARLVAGSFVVTNVPTGICNILAGIVYVGLTFVLLKLLAKKISQIAITS